MKLKGVNIKNDRSNSGGTLRQTEKRAKKAAAEAEAAAAAEVRAKEAAEEEEISRRSTLSL